MLGIRDNFVKVLKKILLLDHKTRVTQTLRRALESAGKYSIREEHDAAFAVHAARWFRPDLIMVDLTTGAFASTFVPTLGSSTKTTSVNSD